MSNADSPAAVPPSGSDTDVESVCRLLWAAAIKNRPRKRGQSAPAKEDTAGTTYLIHNALDHEQLLTHLIAATASAVGALCEEAGKGGGFSSAAAAATAAVRSARQEGSIDQPAASTATAPAAAPQLRKASLLPALQLLTTLSCCLRAVSVHARSRAEEFQQPQVRAKLLAALNQTDGVVSYWLGLGV